MNPISISKGSFIKRFAVSGLIALSMILGVYAPAMGAGPGSKAKIVRTVIEVNEWWQSLPQKPSMAEIIEYFGGKASPIANSIVSWSIENKDRVPNLNQLIKIMNGAKSVVEEASLSGLAKKGGKAALSAAHLYVRRKPIAQAAGELAVATAHGDTIREFWADPYLEENISPLLKSAKEMVLEKVMLAWNSSLISLPYIGSVKNRKILLALLALIAVREVANELYIVNACKTPLINNSKSIATWLSARVNWIQDLYKKSSPSSALDMPNEDKFKTQIIQNLVSDIRSNTVAVYNAAGISVGNAGPFLKTNVLYTLNREIAELESKIAILEGYNFDIDAEPVLERGWSEDYKNANKSAGITPGTHFYMIDQDTAKKRDIAMKPESYNWSWLRMPLPVLRHIPLPIGYPTSLPYWMHPTKWLFSARVPGTEWRMPYPGSARLNKIAKVYWFSYSKKLKDLKWLKGIIESHWPKQNVNSAQSPSDDDAKISASITVPSAAAASSSSTSTVSSASSSSPASTSSQSSHGQASSSSSFSSSSSSASLASSLSPASMSSQSSHGQASSSSSFSSLTSGCSSSVGSSSSPSPSSSQGLTSAAAVDLSNVNLDGCTFSVSIEGLVPDEPNVQRVGVICGKFGPKDALGYTVMLGSYAGKEHLLPTSKFCVGVPASVQPGGRIYIDYDAQYDGIFDANGRPNLTKRFK